MAMAMDGALNPVLLAAVAVFLFLSVWLPCCTSDIVFPLLFVPPDPPAAGSIRPA